MDGRRGRRRGQFLSGQEEEAGWWEGRGGGVCGRERATGSVLGSGAKDPARARRRRRRRRSPECLSATATAQ